MEIFALANGLGTLFLNAALVQLAALAFHRLSTSGLSTSGFGRFIS